jgi:hypothetical protein
MESTFEKPCLKLARKNILYLQNSQKSVPQYTVTFDRHSVTICWIFQNFEHEF